MTIDKQSQIEKTLNLYNDAGDYKGFLSDAINYKIVYFITKSNMGGAQKYVYELAVFLKKNNFEVLVVSGETGTLSKKLEEAKIKNINIGTLHRDISFIKDIKSLIKLYKLISLERPSVLHINSSKAGIIGVIAGRIYNIFNRKKIKIIFTLHGFAFNENRNLLTKIIFMKLYWMIILLSHKTIFVSQQMYIQAMKIPMYFLLKTKIVIIKNAVEPINFIDRSLARNFLQEKIFEKKRLSDDTVIIGVLAELHHIKGLNYLIDAIKILTESMDFKKDFILTIFGEGEERQILEKQISDLGLNDKVFLCGFVEEASKYLKCFDIYVSSSLSEGLSLVLLEAKMAQIPIIATNVGGNVESLNDYEKKIIIEPRNVKQIANSIKDILNTDNLVIR